MAKLITAAFLWFGERLRDLFLWPTNMVRDFPVRSGRLLRTLARAVDAVLFFFPELLGAARFRETRKWLRYKTGRLVDWWHQLLTQVFDLLGGPELGQLLMHLLTRTTPLTADEIAAMAAIVGPTGMRFGDVRVVEGGIFDLIFRLNGNLAFATWHSINLPRTGRHTRENRAIVIHELTHVYQYERVGTRYLGEAIYMLIKTKRDCYNYGGPHGLAEACLYGRRYRHFNREQQAMITQDYHSLRTNGAEISAYEPFIAQVRAGEL